MAMKLIYLTVDGRARIENAKIGTRLVEEPDGYHPVTNDSVWQDAKRLKDAVMIVVQGVLGPVGASMTEADTLQVLYEIDIVERAFKPQSVSKMWQRWLANAFAWFMKYGVILFIVAITGYAVINSLSGGAI
jgi:hypothetical protein